MHPWLLVVGLAPTLYAFYPSVQTASILTAQAPARTFLRGQKEAGSFNPFTSLVGDMASSIMGKSVESAPDVDKSLAEMDIPTWEQVRAKLESLMETDEERNFRQNLDKGYGIGSPLHKIRLFDESNSEKDVRVTFYRDSASWCPYCQKVWLTLEEKKIPYKVEKINMSCYGSKPATFMMMQPSGQIPVATIDGTTYKQSNDILNVLEREFPDHKSLAPPSDQEERAGMLLRLERQIFGTWLYWLTSGGGESLKNGFLQTLGEVERQLSSVGPFFLGADVSMVDFMFAPFLERMAASLLFYKGFVMRVPPDEKTDYPALNRWFDAMETLESYRLTKSDYYTHCWDLPPQLGGCVSEPDGKQYERAVNGERTVDGSRGSWELPLEPHNGGVEPDWSWTGNDKANAREAVERISAHHEAIVRFAARGAGKKGMPPVTAPLADPNASSSDAVVGTVDAFLRITVMSILDDSDTATSLVTGVAQTAANKGGLEFVNGVVDSLVYLRDRVGVPRDMKLPAARLFRAHMNRSIKQILDIVET